MPKNKFNPQWLQDHLQDPYVKRAQIEGYRARAAYKLQEIDDAEKLIRLGMTLVDLGAAPGSWSQYLARKLQLRTGAPSINGRVIALDLLPMEAIEGVEFLQGDFREANCAAELSARLANQRVDVVLSDMAPNLSGIASADAARISHVVELALEFACANLTPNGALLVKCFHGSGYSQLVQQFKQQFHVVRAIKPKASRARSAETFLLGRQLKAQRAD